MTITLMDGSTSHAQTMQCMEIWGGNELVDTSVTVPGLDAWVYSKPFGHSTGGGDVHYVSSCATGRVTRLLVADVSGHGAQVCDVAGVLRRLMRRYVNYIDQGEFVRSMNRQFVEMSDVGCFATAIVTTFFGPTNNLRLCNAGHPPPLMYRAKRGEWNFLDFAEHTGDGAADAEPANIPLGLQDADYEQLDVTLEPGDLVLCYTDSLIEARDGSGDILGTAGLLDLIRAMKVAEPARLIPSLLDAIGSRRPGNLDADDVTALLFGPSGAGTPAALRNKLLAPFRVAKGILASLRSGNGEPAPMPELSIANIGGSMFDVLNRFARSRRR